MDEPRPTDIDSTSNDAVAGWRRVDPDVVAQRVTDEVVIVHLRTNRVFLLNRTGARFWELLNAGFDRDAIVQTMRSEFDVEEPELRREIDEFTRVLSAEELVHGDDRS